MTTQEESSPPTAERIVEVHDDPDADVQRGYFSRRSAWKLAVALFALSVAGALVSGDAELATGLAVVTALFAGAFVAGSRANGYSAGR